MKKIIKSAAVAAMLITVANAEGLIDSTEVFLTAGKLDYAGYTTYRKSYGIGANVMKQVGPTELSVGLTAMYNIEKAGNYTSDDVRTVKILPTASYAITDKFNVDGYIGYTHSSWHGWDMGGLSYGVGVDYEVMDNITIGAMWLHDNINLENPSGTYKSDRQANNYLLKVGYNF